MFTLHTPFNAVKNIFNFFALFGIYTPVIELIMIVWIVKFSF